METKSPTAAELDYRVRQLAVPRANGDAFPGPLEEAFIHEEIMVGAIKVRPVVAGDWLILKKINSPLYQMAIEKATNLEAEPPPFKDEEGFEICYQFTRPPSEVRAALAAGREQFTEIALREMADKYDSITISKIIEAVGKQLQRCYATAIKYSSQEEGKGEAHFFQEPPA